MGTVVYDFHLQNLQNSLSDKCIKCYRFSEFIDRFQECVLAITLQSNLHALKLFCFPDTILALQVA